MIQDAAPPANYAERVRKSNVVHNEGRLARQWQGYPQTHSDRTNLLLHALSVPIFLGGAVALVCAPWVRGWVALAGLGAMIVSLGVQGRGHAMEKRKPDAFSGPVDAIARLLSEQCITFPRFVLSGGFRRRWKVTET